MTKSLKTFAAIILGAVLGLTAFTEGAYLISCAFAEGSPSLLPVANEPAPQLTLEAPLAGPLARGVVLLPYRVENLRILPVLGEGANNVSPRVGHLHVSVDDLPWRWAEFDNVGTIVVAGLPAGAHKLLIELASPEHHVYLGKTVTFTVPEAAHHNAAE
ncbi:DUF6130 family protein [Dongia sp.]|uniref:DUF6130 family protein n=1 Tax=Dongia sp. TaxID=1977262 RepID=UPI0035ADF84F